jgi:hypothetical protein
MSAHTNYANYLAGLAKFKPWYKPCEIVRTPTEIVKLEFLPDGHRLSVRKRSLRKSKKCHAQNH